MMRISCNSFSTFAWLLPIFYLLALALAFEKNTHPPPTYQMLSFHHFQNVCLYFAAPPQGVRAPLIKVSDFSVLLVLHSNEWVGADASRCYCSVRYTQSCDKW